ncbi:MAG TPA: LamG-like jellyroll fold domain-containing protein, partial [Anaerolineae bacterium]|nr:LamG-like jellyroll fold domain-containing protein [Anaerolineae bacterium]
LTDAAGIPFHTDGQGYLQGRGELNLADQLLALAPVHSAIHYEGVVDLDGIDDYVIKNPLNAAPITATTISFWMRSADQDGQGTPLSYATTGSADEFLITNYNNLALYRGAISVTTGVSLTDGLWHHVAVTWREADGQVKLYKDGSAAYTGTLAASSLITSGSLVLGQDQNSLGGGFAPARAFKGNLDDIHIWNVALDETQIQNDMLKPLNGDEDGLVLTWSFDAPAAASIPDRTVWHNDGVLFGATWSSRSFGGYTVYHTNGTPTEIGLSTHSVTQTGVQTLTISAAHPLILFDLNVSLEWDAHKQTAYLQQLENDLAKASTYLYDFTNGQVALGQVTVHQNADDWLSSQVAVYATNRLRPLAVQGGLVTEPITDPQRSNIAYTPGQVRMGAVWNRYGEPGGDISDWPLALAHELSHYLLYQEDVYLGLNEDGLLIPLNTCTGSVMSDMYNPDNTEFIYDQSHWDANCFDTLANRTLGRTEWTTNRLWYPWLITPTLANAGPSRLPFDLTHITIMDPISPTDTLDDPTFYIDYQSGESSSSEARTYLIRSSAQGDYVVDLGSPLGGQNRVYARGAQPGDRLCVLDAARRQFGCEIIELGDERLGLKADASWRPVVQLTPVNSQTLAIAVSGLTETLPLNARLYPENSYGGEPITLTLAGAIYSGTFHLDFPAMMGKVQIWVDEPGTEDNPRREAMVTYSMGGNPGNWPAFRGGWPAFRGGWPAFRGGWPAFRGGWSWSRSSSAPLASPGGQMLFFTSDPGLVQEGNLYTIEGMAGSPPLPSGKTTIGQDYSLIASPNATQLITGSISFQYLSMDVLAEQANEDQLTIHFWDGQTWHALDTVRSPYFNMVSAPSHGPGVYALLAGVTIPQLETIEPVQAVNNVTTTLTIGGHDFLPPVDVLLIGPTTTYTLPTVSATPISITAIITSGLPARQYQVQVINRIDGSSSGRLPFALYDPADACFYDFFESGNGKWQRGGTWDIITLADGNQALTDSPGGSYGVAVSPTLTATTSITSSAFSLSGCSRPVLTFRHDYVIDSRPPSQDWGRVEISTDNGTTWHELAHYTGGLRTGLSKAIINSEWADAQWKEVEIDLSTYTGTVRLRFNLEIDRVGADRG